MKRKIFSIILALALCMGFVVPSFAAEIYEDSYLSISNVTKVVEERFSFTEYEEDDYTLQIIYADSPATVTAIWGIGSIHQATLPDNLREFDFEYRYAAGEEVALSSGSFEELYDGSEKAIEGSTYQLGAGTYYIRNAESSYMFRARWQFLVVGGSPLSTSATPTASTVLVNGESVAFDAYNINGNNYFKLRDLAYTLSGTEKQFEVGWDGANNAIALTSGEAYTEVGGEMTGKGAGNKMPTATTSKIFLDGAEVQFTAYNIEGNNYFKLRDIGETFNFEVDWDGARNTIVIDTSKGYTPD